MITDLFTAKYASTLVLIVQIVGGTQKTTDVDDLSLRALLHIVILNYGKDLEEQAVQRLKPQASQEIEESLKQGDEYTWLYLLCS